LLDPEAASRLWEFLHLTDWQWTINDVLEQDEALLSDIMTIQGLFSIAKELRRLQFKEKK